MTPSLTDEVVVEILRDAHRYVPAIEPHRPTLTGAPGTSRHRIRRAGHRGRDLIERAAGRVGFARRHGDPKASAEAFLKILALRPGLERTAGLLGDTASRRALIDVLKLRVLGPYHAPLTISADRFRAMQAYVDRELLREPRTFEVADPWFSPLSLYEAPTDNGSSVLIHAHSVDIVSVFLLNQYSYLQGNRVVGAEPGDVVFDVGGCWGDTALYLASRVGPTGKVFSFELDPRNLEVMRANLALNPKLAGQIEVVQAALWDRSGETVRFAQGGRMSSATFREAETSALSARTVTVDDFVADADLDRLNFIKMDVEGAEPRVLEGAGASLSRFTPKLAVAAYHQDDDLVTLPEIIHSVGDGYRFFLDTFSPVEEETVLFAANVA